MRVTTQDDDELSTFKMGIRKTATIIITTCKNNLLCKCNWRRRIYLHQITL